MTVYEGVLPGGEGLAEKDARTPEQRAERGDYVGCIAGAPSFAEYRGAWRPPTSATSASPRLTRSPTACTPRSSVPPSP
ncbi:hypothetical protein [Streptomyces sp. NBC_00996]|uniref:hypothetical protein n=1 Tax=Streptomyces sp. NBC_00996 TaxID=2903710 RepID=UPI00386BBD4F